MNSLFEAYKDLYAQITDSDDDFLISEVTFTPAQATTIALGEFTFDLPTDLYKIRMVDFQLGAQWTPMERFSLAARGNMGSAPRYRFLGNRLWITGWTFPGFSTSVPIRVRYYAPPVQPSFPDDPLLYGSAITAANLMNITSPAWANIQAYNGNGMVQNRIYFYVQNGTSICTENIDTKFTATVYTHGSTVTNLFYYKGAIYFRANLAGDFVLYKGTYAPDQATVIFSQVVLSTASINWFYIVGNKIYYSDGANTYSSNLDGSGQAVVLAADSIVYKPLATQACYLNPSGNLVIGVTNLGGAYSAMVNDGTSLVFVLDANLSLHALQIIFTLGFPSISSDTIIQDDVASIGPWGSPGNALPNQGSTAIIPMIGNEFVRFFGLSAALDTVFSYPLNTLEFIESVYIQCAIDFKAKQNQDTDKLKDRKLEVLTRAMENIRRDDYKPEPINNVYGRRRTVGMWTI